MSARKGPFPELSAGLQSFLFRLKIGEAWNPVMNRGLSFKKRSYASYAAYLEHQSRLLEGRKLSVQEKYDAKLREVLGGRLKKLPASFRSKSVLCLAARRGGEVQAFLDQGAFAVGIDLNPGPGNPYVLYGDFHDLPFGGASADAVYLNSLDHVFSVEKILSEISRVLKPGGRLILEVVDWDKKKKLKGSAEGFFDCFSWSSNEDVIKLAEASGFRLRERSGFDFPWPGEQLCFDKEESAS